MCVREKQAERPLRAMRREYRISVEKARVGLVRREHIHLRDFCPYFMLATAKLIHLIFHGNSPSMLVYSHQDSDALTRSLMSRMLGSHMDVLKVAKDHLNKLLSGNRMPREVFELRKYFSLYGAIEFKREVQEDGSFVAISTNFNRGSIITSGKTEEELDRNIKDAILTMFSVPSAYAKEAGVRKASSGALQYAAA